MSDSDASGVPVSARATEPAWPHAHLSREHDAARVRMLGASAVQSGAEQHYLHFTR